MIVIGTPFTKNAGYFKNDDRHSGGRLSEADIRTCTHCQAVIKMQAWKSEGAFCRECFAPICVACGIEMKASGVCVPFMKRIEAYANASMKYLQFSKLAGLEPRLIRG